MTRLGMRPRTARPTVLARPTEAVAISRTRGIGSANAGRRHLPDEARDPAAWQPRSATGVRNFRMMRLLERIATRFSEACVPLMILKGGALHLTLCPSLDDRPMDDLDLMVRPEHASHAIALLKSLGGTPSHALVREDFFPTFHYETGFTIGAIHPIKIDLHVRPFRTLRYARTVPDEAFWSRAKAVQLGETEILVPDAADMVIHLATHAAIHGLSRNMWIEDIARWLASYQELIDVEQVVTSARAWGLALPVRTAIAAVNRNRGSALCSSLAEGLREAPIGWRDRLALSQAPHDGERRVKHVVVSAVTTPGWRFVVAYLRCVLLPDRTHMGDWYPHRHPAWLPLAHVLRWLGPVVPRRTAP